MRVTTTMEGGTMVLKLEGRLADQWVDELTRVARTAVGAGYEMTLDLSGLSFVDTRGIAWLRGARDGGARLTGGSPFITALVQDAAGWRPALALRDHPCGRAAGQRLFEQRAPRRRGRRTTLEVVPRLPGRARLQRAHRGRDEWHRSSR